MRVTVLTNLYPPDVIGGYELLAEDVVRTLRASGHDVSVLTTGTGHNEPDVSRTLFLARPFGREAQRDRVRHWVTARHNRNEVKRYLRERPRPDAVLVMSLRRLGLEPVRAFQREGIPTVFTVNDDWPSAFVASSPSVRSIRSLVAAALDRLPTVKHTWRRVRAPHVVYLSNAIREIVLGAGAPMASGRVCSQGVNTQDFAERPFRPIPPAPRLLFAGRLHPTKAPDVAIEGLAELRRRGTLATLAIAGSAHDPAYERTLRDLADRLGVADAIEWLGQVPRAKLPETYASADVFLFVSRWGGEAQGLTHLEAIASGVSVVAFPMGGAAELFDAHPVVERAASCDGAGVADAVLRLAADPARQLELIEKGREMLRSHASLERYVGVLEEEMRAAMTVGARDAAHLEALRAT